MQPLNRYKTSRLWNINTNIVLADIVSTAATALIIQLLQSKLPTHLVIVTVTAIVDGTISLAVFAGLHTYANRTRGIKDLFRVQLHRWILSPLHYLVGSGLQFMLSGGWRARRYRRARGVPERRRHRAHDPLTVRQEVGAVSLTFRSSPPIDNNKTIGRL